MLYINPVTRRSVPRQVSSIQLIHNTDEIIKFLLKYCVTRYPTVRPIHLYVYLYGHCQANSDYYRCLSRVHGPRLASANHHDRYLENRLYIYRIPDRHSPEERSSVVIIQHQVSGQLEWPFEPLGCVTRTPTP